MDAWLPSWVHTMFLDSYSSCGSPSTNPLWLSCTMLGTGRSFLSTLQRGRQYCLGFCKLTLHRNRIASFFILRTYWFRSSTPLLPRWSFWSWCPPWCWPWSWGAPGGTLGPPCLTGPENWDKVIRACIIYSDMTIALRGNYPNGVRVPNKYCTLTFAERSCITERKLSMNPSPATILSFTAIWRRLWLRAKTYNVWQY